MWIAKLSISSVILWDVHVDLIPHFLFFFWERGVSLSFLLFLGLLLSVLHLIDFLYFIVPFLYNILSYFYVGYFLSAVADNIGTGQKLHIRSANLETSVPRCLTFTFTLCPSNAGILSVFTQTEFQGDDVYVKHVWSRAAAMECTDWINATVELPAVSYVFRVVFEAIIGSVIGQISIDDIQIYEGNCL